MLLFQKLFFSVFERFSDEIVLPILFYYWVFNHDNGTITEIRANSALAAACGASAHLAYPPRPSVCHKNDCGQKQSLSFSKERHQIAYCNFWLRFGCIFCKKVERLL